MLFPISGDRRIDCPCFFVENWLWVSIFPNWAVNRLPDVELLTGTRVRSKGKFYLLGYAHEREALRVFRLSRIRGKVAYATKAEHDFRRSPDFDPRAYALLGPWQFGEIVGTA